MRTDLPIWPDERPWRLLHSHYCDALAARPHLGALPRDLAGFQAAVAGGDLAVTGVVLADGLAYVVTRALGRDIVTVPLRQGDARVTGAASVAVLATVPAKDLGLSRRVLAEETARVELLSAAADVPDDASGLDSL